jgi:TP901 family phage tail tape measure protein
MSALSKLEKLMYTIGITDKASGPVNKIMGKINQLSQQASGAQNQMARGFMGAAGGAMMLVGSLNPAIAANQALGEVSSLGVADSSLQQLNNTAINFSAKYGGNAADVISASYDIQSSFEGIKGNELAKLTNISAVMAKGLKSDASTITDYMGTMKGIYINEVNELGKIKWAEKIAGQTALAVKLFKTDGSKMASAFSNLGRGAAALGVDAAESFAVMGRLQSTMTGSESSTRYRAFFAGVANAQEKLGITLTDNHGKLLPMADVLEAINKKLPDLEDVSQSKALSTAFGSGEATALIQALIPQVNLLRNDVEKFQQIKGMDSVIEMADKQTDAWQRLSGGFSAAATSLGQKVLPIIEPVVEILASMLNGVLWLSDAFPTATGVIAATVVGITALMVGIGLFNIAMGLSKFGMMGFSATTGILSKSMGVLRSALGFTRGALMAIQMQSALSGGAFAAIRVGMLGATSSAWAFTTALLANPIAWVIGGVILLATVIYKYWEPIKAFMSGFWDGFSEGFAPVIAVFSELFSSLSFVGDLFSWVGSLISDVVSWFGELISPVNATSDQLLAAGQSGVTFGETIGAALNFILLPLKIVISSITQVIKALSWAGNAVKDFLGFGGDVDVTAKKVTDINSNLAIKDMGQTNTAPVNNVVPINKLADTNSNLSINNMGQTNTGPVNNLGSINKFTDTNSNLSINNMGQTNTGPVNNLGSINKFTEINSKLSTGNVDNVSTLPINNIVPINSAQIAAERTEQQKVKNTQLFNTNTQKIEKSAIAQQFSSSLSNNNKNDNSKRLYIDNVTLQKENLSIDYEQLMELAG